MWNYNPRSAEIKGSRDIPLQVHSDIAVCTCPLFVKSKFGEKNT